MIIIPAIDIQHSEVVRLHRGNYEQVTSYTGAPEVIARDFIGRGAKRIHLITLLGARDGELSKEDLSAVEAVAKAKEMFGGSSCKLQVGGGIRRLSQIQRFFSLGIDYAIVSTALLLPLVIEQGFALNQIKLFYQRTGKTFDQSKELPEYDLLDTLTQEMRKRVIVGIDVVADSIALSGWQVTAPLEPSFVIDQMVKRGFSNFILTDVSRDGTLEGVACERIEEIFSKVSSDLASLQIVIAGGISREEDVEALALSSLPITGVIIGKALYEGKVDLRSLIRRFQDAKKSHT
ncbi:MAG: HisA/HisF-related TIM barrel protein [Candidatus Ratteibacteria bacterium]|jgi:phosphoribosylformimino-5-aminoimidazole carboxamide ribotide isomerase